MTTIRKVLDLLSQRERRQAYLLVPLVIVMALAEVAGIASIAPFLTLMSNPAAAHTTPLLAWAYNAFAFQSDRSFLIAVGVAVIVLLLVANAILAGGYWILYRFGALRNHTISRRLLIRYLQQPYPFFLDRNSAALANNILQEVLQIINGVVLPGLQLIAKSMATLAIVVLLIVINPLLALMVTVLLGGAYGVTYAATRRYLTRIGGDRVRVNQRRYQAANEAMGGIKALRLMGREGEMVRRFSGPSLSFARYQANSQIISATPRYALEAIAFGSVVAIVLILLSTGRPVAEIVPVLGLYAFAGFRLMPALQQIFAGATQIRYSTGALDEVHAMVRLVDARRADPDAFTDPDSVQPFPFQDGIRVEHVSYRYEASELVIRDVTLEIPARASVAFVGATGAGKSTIIDLLLGLLPPTEGRITIDGVPLEGETLLRWQKQIGYVPQTIFLADDTVARNIAFGVADARIDMDAVVKAARMAQVHEFIEQDLPAGYQTVVGERGVRLSGGQRQRLGIARALYHDPEVLVFDEATSALDSVTERGVYEAVQGLAGNKTTVTIAHRLSTIRNADRLFLLERGRVTAQGTYEELMAASRAFRAMARGTADSADGKDSNPVGTTGARSASLESRIVGRGEPPRG